MTDIKKLLIDLIRHVCCGADAPENIALSDDEGKLLYKLSKSHDLAHIIALCVESGRVSVNEETAAAFAKQKYTAIYRYGHSAYALGALSEALEKAKIPFIPLKGSVIRDYYPEPWMRTSCDIDVLVHKEDLDRAVQTLASVGFEHKYSSAHDVSLYSRTGVHIELHFDLIEDHRANEAAEILSNVWDYAESSQGSEYRYRMRDEMFYFYHIAHMAKHFEDGGCGIRPFLDLWVLDYRTDGDERLRRELLSRCDLLAFAKAAGRLAYAWFVKGEHDELTERMENYLLESGAYGTIENRVAVNRAKKGGRVKYILSRIWQPYDKLSVAYPSLKGRRLLTPIYQVRRWARIIGERGFGKLKTEIKLSSSQSEEGSEQLKCLFDELGLK